MEKAYDKIATRLALILTKLNNGESVTVEELAKEFNVSNRTIQRDLKERFSYIPIKKENKYYRLEPYALGKLRFEDIKNFATLSGIKSLYPQLTNSFLVDILNHKINRAYLVRGYGVEDIKDKKEDFELLSKAIVTHEKVCCTYNNKDRVLKPYKLVNNHGVWYLVADEKNQLKNYSFSKITNLTLLEGEIFSPDTQFITTIEKNELTWFSQNGFTVTLEIAQPLIEYFLRRAILSNQNILEQTNDKLVLSTKVSYEEEILSIVKHGLPHIKIISPQYLQEKLDNILNKYLETTQPVQNV